MSGTYTNLKYHFIWSTEERYPFIKQQIRSALFEYIAGIIRKLDGAPGIINGTEDHIHLLLGLHQSIPVSEAIRKIKANSSSWFKKNASGIRTKFSWQSGYAAFTVSQSRVGDVREYIDAQEEHHNEVSFREEYERFLKRNKIDFDKEYVF